MLDLIPEKAKASLDQFVVIEASGADVFDFLQSQMSQEILHCTTSEAKLAVWCNAKGRSLASFLIWQHNTDEACYRLLLKKDVAETALKRLKMFILRTKVDVSLLELPIWGYWTKDDNIESNQNGWKVQIKEDTTLINYPDSEDYKRILVIGNDNPESFKEFSESSSNFWDALDILSGIPWIEAANHQLFIPQSINMDAVGAINFKKGCYPGQEVVARSHYRGKLKRRAMIGFASDDGSQTAVGTDIYDAEGSPVGIIANQTKLSNQAYIFLFETRLDALENEDGLFIDEEAKTKLDWKSVPYSLEKPEIE